MNNIEFVQKLKDIANNYKTLYVMGCFGAPMTATNKKRYCNNHEYNRRAERTEMIQAASADTFGFDCVNLIKGVLWGWTGDSTQNYGGAKYAVNGVPDIGANNMITKCSDLSTNFSKIEIGEAVWMEGHIGVYIGDGLSIECSPKWSNGVQITACKYAKAGYNRRNWTKHGKLPWVEYGAKETSTNTTSNTTKEVCSVNVKMLKKGDKGDAVKALQTLLIGYGYKMTNNGKNYGVDGDFGLATQNAVIAYQAKKGLTADGIVGPATWGKLLGVN